ncbi:TPR end-of-group domain-containing protein [Anabaena lutea]|uniref:TPR end-of-group domain-containing protein n=1 Tax=Anabaena lutea TaxID=212350 RepID=UPI003BB7E1B1
MTSDFAFLKRLHNAFDPFRPLPAGDPAYVNCQEVRGDGDILEAVGREILYSDRAIRLSPDEYRKMAKIDPDFNAIRQDESFQALIQDE